MTYTPDEEQVREQYTREQPPQVGSAAEKRAEFYRFIARIKADAWDEGRASSGILLPTMPPQQPTNPHRRDKR